MEQTINNLIELENFLNTDVVKISLHEATLNEIQIIDNTIKLDMYLGESRYLWDENIFQNVWKDPRNKEFHIIQTFYGVKNVKNCMYDDEYEYDYVGADILANNLFGEKNIRFHFIPYSNSEVPAYGYIEFEFESYKWEVIGEETYNY